MGKAACFEAWYGNKKRKKKLLKKHLHSEGLMVCGYPRTTSRFDESAPMRIETQKSFVSFLLNKKRSLWNTISRERHHSRENELSKRYDCEYIDVSTKPLEKKRQKDWCLAGPWLYASVGGICMRDNSASPTHTHTKQRSLPDTCDLRDFCLRSD